MARQAQKNAADVAKKWAQNLSSSTQTIQQGVQSVQTAPTALAARNPDAYLQGVQKAVSSGKWQTKLNNVSLQSWQQSMISKGIPRIQTGATAGQPKMQSFMTNFLPFVYSARDQLASQPRGTLQQNISRMNTFVQAMANYKSQ